MTDERSTRETDQRFAELRDIANSLGLVVTDRCQHCNQPIWDPKSLSARAGSVCRVRHGKENDPAGNVAKQSPGKAA